MLPAIRGTIERRLLVNYRVEPEAVRAMLPAPFRPKLARGWAVAGICLIRLGSLRAGPLPAWLGLRSENAAHRIAVEWDEAGTVREGVYIPRRDTSSCFNLLTGGRLFPGFHHAARFDVHETADHFDISLCSRDGLTRVALAATIAAEFAPTPLFATLAEASAFFEPGALGYSVSNGDRLDGLELHTFDWKVEALTVERVESSFFQAGSIFPPGTATFDCALLMRDIAHEWLSRPPIYLNRAA